MRLEYLPSLRRSIETYVGQDFPRDEWELIVMDDNSEDDVLEVVNPWRDHINIVYQRLDHDYGMRGNTVAFNTAFALAKGDIIAETTPETMFTPNAIRLLCDIHINPLEHKEKLRLWCNEQNAPFKPGEDYRRLFVAMKTFNLVPSIQLRIDDYDWRKDIHEISKDPEWNAPWVQNNVANEHFGTHQTCSIRKEVWKEINNGNGFPLFGDYGSEDCWYCGTRARLGIKDITVMDPMMVHQWHPCFQYWMGRGRNAKNLNKHAHSTSNYLRDKSGHVPEDGTCKIWDKGDTAALVEEEKRAWTDGWVDIVRGTGCRVY